MFVQNTFLSANLILATQLFIWLMIQQIWIYSIEVNKPFTNKSNSHLNQYQQNKLVPLPIFFQQEKILQINQKNITLELQINLTAILKNGNSLLNNK